MYFQMLCFLAQFHACEQIKYSFEGFSYTSDIYLYGVGILSHNLQRAGPNETIMMGQSHESKYDKCNIENLASLSVQESLRT